MRRRRTVLLALLLLAGLVAVPVVLTWRQVRQEQLNHALIAAVDRNDVVNVRRHLCEGADPNAQVLPEDKRPFWKRLLDLLRQRPIPSDLSPPSIFVKPVIEPVLMKAIAWSPRSDSDDDNVDTVRALVEAGADVNFRVAYLYQGSTTPFRIPLLLEAIDRSKWKVVHTLLDHHADTKATDDYGRTALMYAAALKNADAVKSLLTSGANINAKDGDGNTALLWVFDPRTILQRTIVRVHFGVSYKANPRLRATVACLLQHGASVNVQEGVGISVMELAAPYCQNDRRLIQMLKQAGAR
jgi:hypothetical protein